MEDPGCDSRWRHGDFSGSGYTSDLNIGSPVATLPGAWCYRVSTGTGQPGVSILWLGEVENLICSFYLNVAAHTVVWADPSLRYSCMLCGCWATNKPQPEDFGGGGGGGQCVGELLLMWPFSPECLGGLVVRWSSWEGQTWDPTPLCLLGFSLVEWCKNCYPSGYLPATGCSRLNATTG